jgi:predicted RNase H-like HicB family nuclease
MAIMAGKPLPARDEARWFRRPAYLGAVRVWSETVAVRGATFQARLRACHDGGYVVTFPALPQLMARGVTRPHARLKALALVERYLRTLPTRQGPAAPQHADERQRGLPLAA